MAKIFIKKNKTPFDVSFLKAEAIKKDWMNKNIPRTQPIEIDYFAGTLGDIASFDMRGEYQATDNFEEIKYHEPSSEERTNMDRISQMVKESFAKNKDKKVFVPQKSPRYFYNEQTRQIIEK